jgi:hypothetical protein
MKLGVGIKIFYKGEAEEKITSIPSVLYRKSSRFRMG